MDKVIMVLGGESSGTRITSQNKRKLLKITNKNKKYEKEI